MKKLILLLLLIPAALGGDGLYISNPFYVAAILRATGAVDGPNVWYDIESSSNDNTDDATANTRLAWQEWVPGASGTLTKFRAEIGTCFGSDDLKIFLCDNSKNYITGATATKTVVIGEQNTVVELTLSTPTAVTGSTSYFIAWMTGGANISLRYNNAAGTYHFNTDAVYASQPANLPVDSMSSPLTRNYVVGGYVD